jgi:hypothetical protein
MRKQCTGRIERGIIYNDFCVIVLCMSLKGIYKWLKAHH